MTIPFRVQGRALQALSAAFFSNLLGGMWAALLLSLAAPLHAAPLHGAELPPGIRIPPGYDVLSTARFGHASRAWIVVALAQHGETPQMDPAPDRPLLLFERRGGAFVKTGENDTVVLRANEGGQCDPFLDGGGVIAVKGHFFTVQNGVACGNHWTDYITFRFDDALGRIVFDNQRLQSWSFNRNRDPQAEALVPDGPPRVRRTGGPKPVPFDDWRPSR